MGKLAAPCAAAIRGKVIAVAGSNGKTGTKHLSRFGPAHSLRGSISPKSFNNDIGVPLAIFPADPKQDYLVLELGTNHPGEIRDAGRIALPDIAIITNCSAEHLEGLGDLDGVRRENAAIIEGLTPAAPDRQRRRSGTVAGRRRFPRRLHHVRPLARQRNLGVENQMRLERRAFHHRTGGHRSVRSAPRQTYARRTPWRRSPSAGAMGLSDSRNGSRIGLRDRPGNAAATRRGRRACGFSTMRTTPIPLR